MTFCKFCGESVDTASSFCPKCGKAQGVVTIEKTGKKWKLMQLVSALILIAGVISCSANTGPNNFESGQTSMLMIFGGFIGFVGGRIGAWWNHG